MPELWGDIYRGSAVAGREQAMLGKEKKGVYLVVNSELMLWCFSQM